MQHGLLPGRIQLEDYAAPSAVLAWVGAALTSGAVKVARRVPNQTCRIFAVYPSSEGMQRGLLTGRIYLEDRSREVSAAGVGGAVKVARRISGSAREGGCGGAAPLPP